MLKIFTPAQSELEMVTLEQLVLADHLLRQCDFIREQTRHRDCKLNCVNSYS